MDLSSQQGVLYTASMNLSAQEQEVDQKKYIFREYFISSEYGTSYRYLMNREVHLGSLKVTHLTHDSTYTYIASENILMVMHGSVPLSAERSTGQLMAQLAIEQLGTIVPLELHHGGGRNPQLRHYFLKVN